MPEEVPEAAAPTSGSAKVDAARRLAEIFGDVLPESTGDDRDQPTAEHGGDPDRWYTENRPPHHDAR